MSKEDRNTVDPQAIAEWLASRRVIARALADLFPGTSPERALTVADAIIARLASHNPPILTAFYPEPA